MYVSVDNSRYLEITKYEISLKPKRRDTNMGLLRYIFSFEVLGVLFLIAAAVYFTLTNKKKGKIVYTWERDLGDVNLSPVSRIKKKRKGWKGRGMGKNEERCREIFQNIFGVPFPSVRPNFLKNPVTGKNLELDGFNENVQTPLGQGLAFEYDGIQHASYNPHYHGSNKDEFVYQCKKDSWKDLSCKEKGILLIRIPHFVPFDDLEKYIRMRCKDEQIL